MPTPSLKPFIEALDRWCTWLQMNNGRAESTVDKYRGYLERYASWVIEPPPEKRLAPASTRDPLRPTLQDLELFAGLFAHTLKLKPRARRPLVSALRGFFAWYTADQGLANPAAALAYPRAGMPLPKAMQLHHAEKLLMSPDISTWVGLRDCCILMLFMGTGLRLSGLCSLNESSLIWCEDDDGREALVVRVVEKGDKERMQPVPREVAMMLRAYLGHEETLAIPRTLANGDRVLFVTQKNHNISPADYHGEARRISMGYTQQMMKERCERAGVPADVAHPHALRHLFGAELAEDEVAQVTHQTLMGHSSADSTKVYSHIAHRRLRREVDRANPLAKMKGPLLDTLRRLDRAVDQGTHVHTHKPAGRTPRPPPSRSLKK